MTQQEIDRIEDAINELQSAIDLIKQDGKDWLDERDIPILEMAISALKAQEAKHSTESSLTHKALDTISRQAAIDALDVGAELLRRVLDDADIVGAERAKYKWGLGLIESCIADVKELPPAQPESEERTEESAQNVPKEDLISRKAAIEAIGERPLVWTDDNQYALGERNQYDIDRLAIETLPSAQPQRCEDCVNFSKTRLLIPQAEKCTEERTETHACDCISRKAAIDYCYHLINVEHQQGSDEMNYGQERVNQTETILHHLEFMPSAQPPHSGRRVYQAGYADGYKDGQSERKKGKWIMLDKGLIVTSYKCSKCGRTVWEDTGYDVLKDYPFCHCGADMRGEKDAEAV